MYNFFGKIQMIIKDFARALEREDQIIGISPFRAISIFLQISRKYFFKKP